MRIMPLKACPEKMELKQKLFGKLDKICPPYTVFATNTSSLKLSEMIQYLPEERQEACNGQPLVQSGLSFTNCRAGQSSAIWMRMYLMKCMNSMSDVRRSLCAY